MITKDITSVKLRISLEKKTRYGDSGELDLELPLVSHGLWQGSGFRLVYVVDKVLPGYGELTLSRVGSAGEIKPRWLRLTGLTLPEGTVAALANGLNGWSYSPMLDKRSVLKREDNPKQEPFGDHDFYAYAEQPGVFHAWSYTVAQVLADGGKPWGNHFWGSLSEDRFNALYEMNLHLGTIELGLDVGGVELGVGDIAAWYVPGEEAQANLGQVMARYSEILREKLCVTASKKVSEPVLGYTSWYYRYRDISSEWLKKNLQALPSEWSVFQVDDGYQTVVGDWQDFTAGFADGLKPLFKQVVDAGKKPGIWCAPFIVHETSNLYRAHPEWLLRDEAGESVLCGDFPHWGGKFFALDTELSSVKSHISDMVNVFKEWGARFIKADFLYASGKVHAGGLPRAARASRAHKFLYDECQAQGITLLSCGATSASAYLNCDFARIGPDVLPSWEDPHTGHFASREKCSTRASIVNAITRFPLNICMHGNDPDVYMVRDDENRLTSEQRALLMRVNHIFGQLVFCSDYWEEVSPEAKRLVIDTVALRRRLGNHRVRRLGLALDGNKQCQIDSYQVETTGGLFHVQVQEKQPWLEMALKV